MSEHVEKTLEMVVGQIGDLQRQVGEKKKIANGLCQLMGRDPLYADESEAANRGAALRPDEFYGRPLATVVQEVLDRRRLSGLGAATVPEIYDSLVRGGFHFNTKNAENAKRNLYQSLGKNAKFHRLPNGTYGLTEWYPNVRKNKDPDDSQPEEQDNSEATLMEEELPSGGRDSFESSGQEPELSGGPKKSR